jgi:hypothetical protein
MLILNEKSSVGYRFSANGSRPQIQLSQLLTKANAVVIHPHCKAPNLNLFRHRALHPLTPNSTARLVPYLKQSPIRPTVKILV